MCRNRTRRAFERNMFYFDAGLIGKQSRTDVPHGSGRRVSDGNFTGMRFAVVDEFLHGIVRFVFSDRKRRSVGVDADKRIEIGIREIDQTLLRQRIQFEGYHTDRISVRSRVFDCSMTDSARTSRFIFDGDRRTEVLFRSRTQRAQNRIRTAAGAPRADYRNAFFRIIRRLSSLFCKGGRN